MKRLEIQLFNEETKESITLPVNPSSIEIPQSIQNNTYNILGFGEVNVLGDRSLKRVTLSNVLPEDGSVFSKLAKIVGISTDGINTDLFDYNLNNSIELVENWLENKNKVRLIISNYFNELMEIISFTKVIKESNRDIVYNIELIEFVDPEQKAELKTNTKIALSKRPLTQLIPNQKVITSDETLYSLAKRYYGDGAKWIDLAELNNIKDENTDLTGQTLRILTS